jgi:acetate kinase
MTDAILADAIPILSAGSSSLKLSVNLECARVNTAVPDALDCLLPLAPLREPHDLAAIRALAARASGLVQVACFDTVFQTTQPLVLTRP